MNIRLIFIHVSFDNMKQAIKKLKSLDKLLLSLAEDVSVCINLAWLVYGTSSSVRL